MKKTLPVTAILQATFICLVFLLPHNTFSQTTRYSIPNGDGIGGTDWTTAGDLQATIDASNVGDSVFVMAGSYILSTSLIMKDGIKMYGGFAGTETYLAERAIGNTAADSSILNGNNSVRVIDNSTNNLTTAAVLDGFTVTGGYVSFSGKGAAMYNVSSSPTINHCIFSNNFNAGGSPGGDGGGIYNSSASPVISNCSFTNNKAGGVCGAIYNNASSAPIISHCNFIANIGAAGGGAIYNASSSPIIRYCIFSKNVSQGSSTRGGAISNNSNSAANISNCIFYKNTSGLGGAICNTTNCAPTISNCSFWSNTAISGGDIYNRGASNPIIKNCIIYGNSTGIINNTNSVPVITYSLVQGMAADATNLDGMLNPFFADTTNGNLQLMHCSPAINAGDTTGISQWLGNTDLADSNRYIGTIDMGAYEYNGATYSTDSIAGSAQSTTITQQLNGNSFYTVNCDSMIATVQSNGANPIAGNTTAYVWVETTEPSFNGSYYVARHYQVTPATNASTATATITLYFTQTDFDNYNAVTTGTPLPANSSDAVGIGNLLIVKFSGTSSDGSGLMGSYSQDHMVIDPTDNNIVWNEIDNRWEVSFAITGFSGFFIQSTGSVLPVKWISASAQLNAASRAVINWEVQEQNVVAYEVQQSVNGSGFSTISTVNSKGNGLNNYSFTQDKAISGNNLYRIKQTGNNGAVNYSTVMQLQSNGTALASVYPNPATDNTSIHINISKAQTIQYLILDNAGRIVQQNTATLNAGQTVLPLNVAGIATGIYHIAITGEDINEQLQFIKK